MHEIQIWVDGSCLGNPGPMGVGFILESGKHRKEFSTPIPQVGTNGKAEISAVSLALKAINHPDRSEVVLHTDSFLVHGIIELGWKARKNKEEVAEMKQLISECKNFKCIGVPRENEIIRQADKLAKTAAEKAKMALQK